MNVLRAVKKSFFMYVKYSDTCFICIIVELFPDQPDVHSDKHQFRLSYSSMEPCDACVYTCCHLYFLFVVYIHYDVSKLSNGESLLLKFKLLHVVPNEMNDFSDRLLFWILPEYKSVLLLNVHVLQYTNLTYLTRWKVNHSSYNPTPSSIDTPGNDVLSAFLLIYNMCSCCGNLFSSITWLSYRCIRKIYTSWQFS